MSSSDVDIDDPRYRISPTQQMAASCSGALLTSLFMTPFDVVKIRLQAQEKLNQRCFLYCNGLMDHLCPCNSNGNKHWYQRPGHFNGTIDAFVKISRNEGIASLWSGLSPTLVLAVPATIVYFVSYEQIRLALKDWYNRSTAKGVRLEQPVWIPLIAGATARVFSASIVSPLELVRTKMQSQKYSYREMHEALQSLVRVTGARGLWKGLPATLLRDVPFSAMYWMNYEAIKRLYGPGVPSFGFSFLAGAISGSIAATLTIPFDVVKTHQQIEIGEKEIYTKNPSKAHSTTEVMQTIYRHSGVRGLFRGLTPRIMRVAPACAIMISTFEYSKQALHRSEEAIPVSSSM